MIHSTKHKVLAQDVHGLGNGGHDRLALQDDDVGVGHQRDRAAPLVGLAVEDGRFFEPLRRSFKEVGSRCR